MSFIVVLGLPATALVGTIVIPIFGWRAMFIIGGIGALVVWYLRKALPESPRWLESVSRYQEAEALLQSIEAEVSKEHWLRSLCPSPTPTSAPSRSLNSLLSPVLLPRMIVGCIALITVNTLIFGFVTWLPTFFVHSGRTMAQSFNYSLIISIGAPIGSAIAALHI